MTTLSRRVGRATAAIVLLLCPLFPRTARADWQRSGATIAWRAGTNVLWAFSFDPQKGKPFFHPLTAGVSPILTSSQPKDHAWHYGLWFSWKYINHVNYWEEDKTTGRADGATHWTAPDIQTQADGSATLRLQLTYVNPSNRVEMTESRVLRISAQKSDGSYAIDWRTHFVVGDEEVVLDRTPMPDDPGGQTNGGYAGLGLHFPGPPLSLAMLCSTGLVTQFVNDRARPFSPAAAFNLTDADHKTSGIAIFSDPANSGPNAPWYFVNSSTMRWACAAVLAPKPITLPAGGQMDLHYCIVIQARGWTPESLNFNPENWF